MRLLINNQDIAPLLSGPPKTQDELDGVCRTLEFTVQAADGLENYLGQSVQLYLDNDRWYFGFLEVRGREAAGQITYKAYDPLYFLKKNPYDYYFKNMTAKQIATHVCEMVGVSVGSLADTGAVLQPAYYPKAEGDKVIIDGLAKTYRLNGKKYWLRFNPADTAAFGTEIYERVVPSEIWAFQRGVNLISAHYEESLEELFNIVRLINRETGKTVTRLDSKNVLSYGARTYVEEVDKDHADDMDKNAGDLLAEKNKVKTTISLEGINPDLVIPQLFSGDVIYCEESTTGIFGAYHIHSIGQTFINSTTIQLTMDVQTAPDIPPVQFEDAEKQSKEQAKKADGKGVQEVYGSEMLGLIDKYGLDKKS